LQLNGFQGVLSKTNIAKQTEQQNTAFFEIHNKGFR
jgi:hypothetical protein